MDPSWILNNNTPSCYKTKHQKTSIYIPVNSGWLVMGSLFHGLYTVEANCIPWKCIVLIQKCPFLGLGGWLPRNRCGEQVVYSCFPLKRIHNATCCHESCSFSKPTPILSFNMSFQPIIFWQVLNPKPVARSSFSRENSHLGCSFKLITIRTSQFSTSHLNLSFNNFPSSTPNTENTLQDTPMKGATERVVKLQASLLSPTPLSVTAATCYRKPLDDWKEQNISSNQKLSLT